MAFVNMNPSLEIQFRKELKASDPLVRELLRTIPLPFHDVLVRIRDVGPDADELGGKLEDFRRRSEMLERSLQNLTKEATDSYNNEAKEAALAFKHAISRLMPVANAISGDFDEKAHDVDAVSEAVSAAGDAFEKAAKRSRETSDSANRYQAQFTQLRNGDTSRLQKNTDDFGNDLASLVSQNQAQLDAENATLALNRSTLADRQRDLKDAQDRYQKAVDDAESAKLGEIFAWIFCWPVGLALHYTVSKNLIEDVSNQQFMVDLSNQHIDQIQRDIADTQGRASELQRIISSFVPLETAVRDLHHKNERTLAAAEARSQTAHDVDDKMMATWAKVKTSANEFEASTWSINKKQYAAAILQTLNDARFQESIKGPALEILRVLQAGDDSKGSVKSIMSPLFPGQFLLAKLIELYEAS